MCARLLDNDEMMLTQVIATEDEEGGLRPFREMLERNRPLSARQQAWLRDVHERRCGILHYENLASSGGLARGREVELMVKDKPLRPPQRRGTLDE